MVRIESDSSYHGIEQWFQMCKLGTTGSPPNRPRVYVVKTVSIIILRNCLQFSFYHEYTVFLCVSYFCLISILNMEKYNQ